MQIRKLTLKEREMSVWLNEDYHAYNQMKALKAIQNTDYQLIKDFGDRNDEIIAHSNTYENKINTLEAFIIKRREKKEKMFMVLPSDVRAVMDMHYLAYKTLEETAEELNYHVSSVKRKHISGLEQLCRGNTEWQK